MSRPRPRYYVSEPESVAQILIKMFIKYRPLIIEALVVISIFSVMGHFTFNTWQRVVVKSHLKNLKTEMCALSETIDIIHGEYDNLHNKVCQLADETAVTLEKDVTARKLIDEKHRSIKNIKFNTSNNGTKGSNECQSSNNEKCHCKYEQILHNNHGNTNYGAGDAKYIKV